VKPDGFIRIQEIGNAGSMDEHTFFLRWTDQLHTRQPILDTTLPALLADARGDDRPVTHCLIR